ncbi:MAG TPA: HD domain-containing protein [Candidatus Blautia avicola]|uniref:HD domain-containing protein n=1 Tax=Candidatus Blautia avicola TaxID=2838483 RepID=A0A9D2QWE5_9FIRM|nr:HD domain-containing protein [Candidatus Blautia avicola]
MAQIDIEHAKKEFDKYLQDFDLENPKILLKKVHTYGVIKAADYICTREELGAGDRDLALLIALLHDIGRFEQLRAYNSYDDDRFDHARFGVKLLFEQGKIRDFISCADYDEVIRQSIACHSMYRLPEIQDPRILLHCKIIRDADKLDNFRVKSVDSLEAHFDLLGEIIQKEGISENVLQAVRDHRCVRREERKTHLDMWVSYMAFIFDLNFSSSFRFIQEHDYINRCIDRMDYSEKNTKESMEEVRRICLDYVQEYAER